MYWFFSFWLQTWFSSLPSVYNLPWTLSLVPFPWFFGFHEPFSRLPYYFPFAHLGSLWVPASHATAHTLLHLATLSLPQDIPACAHLRTCRTSLPAFYCTHLVLYAPLHHTHTTPLCCFPATLDLTGSHVSALFVTFCSRSLVCTFHCTVLPYRGSSVYCYSHHFFHLLRAHRFCYSYCCVVFCIFSHSISCSFLLSGYTHFFLPAFYIHTHTPSLPFMPTHWDTATPGSYTFLWFTTQPYILHLPCLPTFTWTGSDWYSKFPTLFLFWFSTLCLYTITQFIHCHHHHTYLLDCDTSPHIHGSVPIHIHLTHHTHTHTHLPTHCLPTHFATTPPLAFTHYLVYTYLYILDSSHHTHWVWPGSFYMDVATTTSPYTIHHTLPSTCISGLHTPYHCIYTYTRLLHFVHTQFMGAHTTLFGPHSSLSPSLHFTHFISFLCHTTHTTAHSLPHYMDGRTFAYTLRLVHTMVLLPFLTTLPPFVWTHTPHTIHFHTYLTPFTFCYGSHYLWLYLSFFGYLYTILHFLVH